MENLISEQRIVSKIYLMRGQKVMLDRDLAALYKVETKVLNQAVKRNISRFPEDFMFQLTAEELENWKSQIVTSNSEKMGLRKLPFVFTEQGVAMLSSVLKSEIAISVNIQIIRIFTRMRELFVTHKELFLRLEQMEHKFLSHDITTNRHESEIQVLFETLKQLLAQPEEKRKKIGYAER
ncbi:MAG: ORF6N domain-containing protein [Bacteroidia bacterium]